jgi:hypothetical protein
MITYDAGSGYAQRMGWEYSGLDKWKQYRDYLNIIDCRISEAECEWVENLIQQQRQTQFVLRIVDPYYSCHSQAYYRLLFRVKDWENVRFLSPYQPTELVKQLQEAAGDRKVIWLPYPFIVENNVTTNMAGRRKQVIFSGARNPHLYPERQAFISAVRRNPLLWGKVHHLKHPGYPDTGQPQQHMIVGKYYIQYLSKFRWMFISPSRCRLEFLKYSECANAGCVPVGQPPDSFSNRLRQCFISLDFERLYDSFCYLFSMPFDELQAIANEYRLAMTEERNPALLNDQLNELIRCQSLL